MRGFETCQTKVHDTEQSLTQYQTASEHDDLRLTSAVPSSPPQVDQTSDSTCERERRCVVHACAQLASAATTCLARILTNSKGNAARHEIKPLRA